MQAVTIKTLATTLNLSTATVSKALSNSYDISEETKLRVRKLAEELHYVPDLYASSLRKRKSKTIAVVIPEVADSFFSQAINGIESVAREKGYHVLIYLTHESYEREKAILKDFQSGRVDGVLISVTAETTGAEHIRELTDKDIPVVFFDRICDDVDTAKITTNDYEGGYIATKHLFDCGCRSIALLSVSDSLSISNQRMLGYIQALKDCSLIFDRNNIIHCTQSELNNYALLKEIMMQEDHPDGIIATVEKLTTTVYLVCRELGLQIPRQVKIISFSNLQSAVLLNPSRTTVTQPAFEMGNAAAALLFKGLGKKKFDYKNESLIIPSLLEIRSSTQQGEFQPSIT
jgi:LacI family transcriptional regulator